MDAVDHRLIELLQRDATLTNERLGELAGASPSSVHRRLRRLWATGAIRSINAVADQAKLGRPMTFVVGLEIARKNAKLYDQLQRWIASEDAIQQAYNVTGSNDFVIVLTARSVEDYDAFMDRMIEAHSNILKFTTNVVLRSLKKSLFVPVS